MMTVLIIGGGMWQYERLGRLEDPEFTIKNAQIFTNYPGATAMEVGVLAHQADSVTLVVSGFSDSVYHHR